MKTRGLGIDSSFSGLWRREDGGSMDFWNESSLP